MIDRKFLKVAALGACLSFACIGPAHAGDEDEPGMGAMTADMLIGRPGGLVATVLGTATFLVSLPFSAAGGNVGEAAEHLVMKPAKATFVRCLGCKNQRRYQDPDE